MGYVRRQPYLAQVTVRSLAADAGLQRIAKEVAGMSTNEGKLFWPSKCCCCDGTKGLEHIVVSYAQSFGNQIRTTRVGVPCCKQCKLHLGSSSGAENWAIALFACFTAFALLALTGALSDGSASEAIMGLVLLSIGIASMLLLKRVARNTDEVIKRAFNAKCTGGQNDPVALVGVDFAGMPIHSFSFRFCNLQYAQEFAAQNRASASALATGSAIANNSAVQR